MQVILLKQIDTLGHVGDVKDVTDGYFRNFLFPRGLAQLATPAGLQQAERMRTRALKKRTTDKDEFLQLIGTLQKEHLGVLRKATDEGHLFGSVSEHDIMEILAAKGYRIDEKQISIEAPIKELGTYPILLKFDEGITGTISVTVEREA